MTCKQCKMDVLHNKMILDNCHGHLENICVNRSGVGAVLKAVVNFYV